MRATLSDPDVLELRGGGGVRTLIGAILVLAAAGWIAAPFVVRFERISLGYGLSLWLALAMIPVGGIVACGRWGRTFDRRQSRYTWWWGLLIPLIRRRRTLDAYSAVRLEKSVVETSGGSGDASSRGHYVCYPVTLVSAGEPRDNLCVERNRRYFRARRTAEAVARFLELPLHDSSSGKEVIREAAALDQSFADRAVATGEELRLPLPPPDARAQCRAAGEGADITLPRLGLNGFQVVFVVIWASAIVAAVAYAAAGLSRIDDDPDAPATAIPALVGALFLLVLLGPAAVRTLYRALSRERISVSREGLTMRRRWLLFGSRRRFATRELEELEMREPDGREGLFRRWGGRGWIGARSDRTECEFGRSLSPGERRWLYETVRYALIRGSPWM